MKKIINNKVYDTDTAKFVGSYDSNPGDLYGFTETLYRKKTGEYFLHGEGGAGSKYSRSIGNNSWAGSAKIIPLTRAAAKEWAEEHLTAEKYDAEFGIPDEGEGKDAMCIWLPADLLARVKARASDEGKSVTALMEDILRETFK